MGNYKTDCIFCKIAQGQAHSWKVLESERAFAFLDINPVSKFHTLIIPRHHYENVFEIPESGLKEVIALAKKVAILYKERHGIENLQILSSNGREAQQDVFHLHFHIVPRRLGGWSEYFMEDPSGVARRI